MILPLSLPLSPLAPHNNNNKDTKEIRRFAVLKRLDPEKIFTRRFRNRRLSQKSWSAVFPEFRYFLSTNTVTRLLAALPTAGCGVLVTTKKAKFIEC